MNLLPRARGVGPIEVEIAAPAAMVFQMLAAIGQGVQRPGERAEVVSRPSHGPSATTSPTCATAEERVVRSRVFRGMTAGTDPGVAAGPAPTADPMEGVA